MSTTPPPPVEVLVEFLRAVAHTAVEFRDGFVPVVRGSLLLRHWYGARARPPADIDIECFDRPPAPDGEDDDEDFGRDPGTFGRYGEYRSRVDLGKATCRYAAIYAEDDRPADRRVGIRFEPVEDPPADGASLWVYGTPGTRYYAEWGWAGHEPGSGRLQIDLAEPGPYTPDDLATADEAFTAPGGDVFRVAAYSREAMLAAKVSWLVRGVRRGEDGEPAWAGEPKDLFDAHLILTAGGDLRPDVFRRAMLAVGAADGLGWTAFGDLFAAARGAAAGEASAGWAAFAARHPGLAPDRPGALWTGLAARLGPLLGDLYPVAELPFLAAVDAGRGDETPYLVYADWLDDHDDPGRAAALRQVAAVLFRPGEATAADRVAPLAAALRDPTPWHHLLFGTSARLRAFRDRLGGPGA